MTLEDLYQLEQEILAQELEATRQALLKEQRRREAAEQEVQRLRQMLRDPEQSCLETAMRFLTQTPRMGFWLMVEGPLLAQQLLEGQACLARRARLLHRCTHWRGHKLDHGQAAREVLPPDRMSSAAIVSPFQGLDHGVGNPGRCSFLALPWAILSRPVGPGKS